MFFDKKKKLLYRKLINGFVMKRFFYSFLCFFTLISSLNISARSKLIDSPIYEEGYSWETTDAAQKKQSVGMTVTGIIFFFLIAIISGSIEPSAGEKTAPAGKGDTDNTLLT